MDRRIPEEYADFLPRPKFAFPPDEIEAMLSTFRSQGERFHPADPAPDLPDPVDAMFRPAAGVALAE